MNLLAKKIILLCSIMMLVFLPGLDGLAKDDNSTKIEPHEVEVKLYTPEIEDAVHEGLRFLMKNQKVSGAFGGDAQVSTTSLAGLALLANGTTLSRGKYSEVLAKSVRFLLKVQKRNSSGYFFWSGKDTQSRMHGHGFALMFLAEVYGTGKPSGGAADAELKRIKKSLNKAIALVVKSQSAEGGWDYDPTDATNGDEGSITVCIVEGLRACRNVGIVVPKATIDSAVEYMRKSWNGENSFHYRLGQKSVPSVALSAAGACVLIASGEQSDKTQNMIKKATQFVLTMPPFETLDARYKFWFYSHFYSTQALYFQGGQRWNEWYTGISKKLLKIGTRTGRQRYWISPSNEAGGDKSFATAMALLILQMPNAYLPIFQN